MPSTVRRPYRAAPGSAQERLLRGERFVHIEDVRANPTSPQNLSSIEAGTRTLLLVPLRKEGALLGFITSIRREVRPFSEKEIALLESFAAQAVIAMENARLLTETREALGQQTATAEVLQVINSLPGDLGPVFDAVLEKSLRLCDGSYGNLLTFDGAAFHPVATKGNLHRPAWVRREAAPLRPQPGFILYRLIQGEDVVHVPNLIDDEAYRISAPLRELADVGGVRTVLTVALRQEDKLLGTITIYRQEVRPFSDKQIALLQNFAAQAVIAMENARLLTETREALEKQTAMAEILRVISASPTDVQPTFDAIAASAVRICGAANGGIFRFDGSLIHFAAHHGWTPEELEGVARHFPLPPGPQSVTARAILTREVAHVADISADPEFAPTAIAQTGLRATLSVPMLKDGTPLGAITVTRYTTEPFTEAQIDLLKTFADQAVIAIENVRLFNELNQRTSELQEALEYQTATSNVLQVISRSAFDLQRVLETLAESAAALAQSDTVFIFRREGEGMRLVAQYAPTPAFGQVVGNLTLGPDRRSTTGRAFLSGEVVRIANVQDEPDYQLRQSELDRIGSTMAAPLLRGGETVGVITLARLRVEPYSDRHVELVRTFADQAVIAMENARLLGELRRRTRDLEESLEYQTATGDVLKVISHSTFDLQPVLDTLVETATRLCGSDGAGITIREGDAYRYLATYALDEAFVAMLRGRTFVPNRGSIVGRVALTGEIVHIEDAAADPDYQVPEVVTQAHMRTLLGAPMLRDGVVVGTLTITRARVEPFTERQIDLVRTFADQAVIAIENTRLITETREALERQTATAEVLQVINSSPGDLAPVFDAMLQRATRLCEAETAHLLRYEAPYFTRTASLGVPEDFDKILPLNTPVPHIITRDSIPYRMLASRAVVHVPDAREDESVRAGAPAETAAAASGIRTALFVPLLREGDVVGGFVMHRMEVKPFTDKQIGLLQSFAAQAVIAMDNARLLDEIRQRQAELRVTFDNMGDGVAMFDGEMRLAAWNMNFQKILDLPDAFVATRPTLQEYFQYMEARGEYGTAAPELEAEIRRGVAMAEHESRFERTRPDGTVIEVRRNAVPGGGSVLIFSDVTERKRAEAEIHAARDAAEKALAELRQTQQQLVVQQKMAALGQLTAGIAHEIKNPLNFVNNFASLSNELLDELKEIAEPAIASLSGDKRAELDETIEMLSGNLSKIVEHGRRADNIVKGMLEHSRGVSGEPRQVDLNALVEEALNLAYHGARAQDPSFNITLERDFDATLQPIELVPQDMTRVFLNLIGNGFYAANKRAHADGGVRPVLRVATHQAGDAVEVKVRDNGTGIPPEIRDKLFQPFFTTKPTGEGTGLGLSISYDIVTQQHGGTITVDSEPRSYTEFTIRLPRH